MSKLNIYRLIIQFVIIFATLPAIAQYHSFTLSSGYSWGWDNKNKLSRVNRSEFDISPNGIRSDWKYVKPQFAEGVNIIFSYDYMGKKRFGGWFSGGFGFSGSHRIRYIHGQFFETDMGHDIWENHFETFNIIFRGGISYNIIEPDFTRRGNFFEKISLKLRTGISTNLPQINVRGTSPPESRIKTDYKARLRGYGLGFNFSTILTYNLNKQWGINIHPGFERLKYYALGIFYETKYINGFNQLNYPPGHPFRSEPQDRTFNESLELPFHNYYILMGINYRIKIK